MHVTIGAEADTTLAAWLDHLEGRVAGDLHDVSEQRIREVVRLVWTLTLLTHVDDAAAGQIPHSAITRDELIAATRFGDRLLERLRCFAERDRAVMQAWFRTVPGLMFEWGAMPFLADGDSVLSALVRDGTVHALGEDWYLALDADDEGSRRPDATT